MAKEAVEDFRRGKLDKKVNNDFVLLWKQNEGFEIRRWKDIKVGDIVKVNRDDFFPADLLFLSSSDSDGLCYVETMNLDGETNLKLRRCLEETRNLADSPTFRDFNAVVECSFTWFKAEEYFTCIWSSPFYWTGHQDNEKFNRPTFKT
ncbi:hypothetical protein SUGI_0391990 [Cryptomeria japonica]|nr:hypothetical protein SUGI_0391990 [Cryptomeria japonica]